MPVTQGGPTAKPNPTVVPWDPSQANRPPQVSNPSGSAPTPPPLPAKGSGSGNTSVDTPSLELFASNIQQLVGPVQQVAANLKAMAPVEPGAFYQADQIRSAVTGDNGDGGVRDKYQLLLTDLAGGLTDLANGIKILAGKYTTGEEFNKVTADQVTQALNGATSYFTGAMSDVGGSGSSSHGSG